MPCTVWPPRFQRWFDKKFGVYCDEHDRKYILKYDTKWDADMILARRIWDKGYHILATFVFLFCLMFGWIFWYNHGRDIFWLVLVLLVAVGLLCIKF